MVKERKERDRHEEVREQMKRTDEGQEEQIKVSERAVV